MEYRKLSYKEISQLEKQNCSCENWTLIDVKEGFDSAFIQHVKFSGNCKLGIAQKQFFGRNGVKKHTGIYYSCIHNCTIDDNVYIHNVHAHIANYHIEEDAFIENINMLEVHPEASFGNGVRVAVLDETGSRELPIYEEFNAATAYLLATYKHEAASIQALELLIEDYSISKTSDMGRIGKRAQIYQSGSIINVNIGDFARVEGASLLQNGTISSSSDAPTYVGLNVIAKDFIISKGAKVKDAAQLEACFVGEACLISKQFSAVHSLFFANCEMMHGEAVSTFAGPFTVSHHKSTLLIGGMFSFFNAGSGSNMSNHMYKLGPTHYGVMQRGSKMASDSYLMWPGKIGAFTVVIGKFKKHIDTSSLPFSYIIDSKGDYSIMPAMNITSVGTYRDSKKWLNRDARKNTDTLDNICFESLNPFIVSQLQKGIETLSALKEKNPQADSFSYNSCKISAAFVSKAITLYQMMIDIYLGEILLRRYNSNTETSGKWLDLSGLIVSESALLKTLQQLINGEVNSIPTWNEALNKLHSNLSIEEAAWAKQWMGTDKNLIINNAISANEKYKSMLLSDARKEFNADAKTCFGLDNDAAKGFEFELLRGKFEDNKTVAEIESYFNEKVDSLKKL